MFVFLVNYPFCFVVSIKCWRMRVLRFGHQDGAKPSLQNQQMAI